MFLFPFFERLSLLSHVAFCMKRSLTYNVFFFFFFLKKSQKIVRGKTHESFRIRRILWNTVQPRIFLEFSLKQLPSKYDVPSTFLFFVSFYSTFPRFHDEKNFKRWMTIHSGVFPLENAVKQEEMETWWRIWKKEERRISIWWERNGRTLEGPIDFRNLGVGPFEKKCALV